MNLKLIAASLALLFLWGCNAAQEVKDSEWQEINGRTQRPVYRARVPAEWVRLGVDKRFVEDTTLPLAEFLVDEGIIITVHNFPDINIPPAAQVARWKKQMAEGDPKCLSVTPCSHGGFAGLRLECKKCLAWAMQLDSGHRQKLSQDLPHFRQMRADYTIKAVGPPEKLAERRREIDDFALSFELIQEIPR